MIMLMLMRSPQQDARLTNAVQRYDLDDYIFKSHLDLANSIYQCREPRIPPIGQLHREGDSDRRDRGGT